jgi:hypothetical protein
VARSCQYRDEPSGSGATAIGLIVLSVVYVLFNFVLK